MSLADGRYAISFDGQIVFVSETTAECGGYTYQGFSIEFANNGRYIATVASDYVDEQTECHEALVFSSEGDLLSLGDQAPGFPVASEIFGLGGVSMTDDGTAHWTTSFTADLGGGLRNYSGSFALDASGGTITPQLFSGDPLGSGEVQGISYYTTSDDGSHIAIIFTDALGAAPIPWAIAIDDTIVVSAFDFLDGGQWWERFQSVSINNAGDYLFSGQTSASFASDSVLAYNGEIVLAEGDELLGETLEDSSAGALINNLGEVVFAWDSGETNNILQAGTVYYSADPANLRTTSRKLLELDDQLDTTGDGIADSEVIYIFGNRASPGFDLGEGNTLIIAVSIASLSGGDPSSALIEIPLGCTAADLARPFAVLDLSDIQGFVGAFTSQDDAADLAAPQGVWDLADLSAFISAFVGGCP